jgi:hypothetical protein
MTFLPEIEICPQINLFLMYSNSNSNSNYNSNINKSPIFKPIWKLNIALI